MYRRLIEKANLRPGLEVEDLMVYGIILAAIIFTIVDTVCQILGIPLRLPTV